MFSTVAVPLCIPTDSALEARVPVSAHPHQHLLFSIFLILATLVSVKWYLIVVFGVCFFFITDDVSHLFVCLLTICVCFFGVFFFWRNIVKPIALF